jgi:hypothetical protein
MEQPAEIKLYRRINEIVINCRRTVIYSLPVTGRLPMKRGLKDSTHYHLRRSLVF